MTFRHRNINAQKARTIASYLLEEEEDALTALAEKRRHAHNNLSDAFKDAFNKCEARDRWFTVPKNVREDISTNCLRYGELSWVDTIFVRFIEVDGEDIHVGVEARELDFNFLCSGRAEQHAQCFVGEDWPRWDAYAQAEDILVNVLRKEVDEFVQACKAQVEKERSIDSAITEIEKQIAGRNTKQVIASWPEAEEIIHKTYDYEGTTTKTEPLVTPLATAIKSAMTPAITHIT